jgi:RNA polymerase sigma factor (sigma-70 family)
MTESRHALFSRLFAGSSGSLKRYVRRLVHSREATDEIVQEAFLRAYEHAEYEKPPAALLYSIARNLAMDHHRHERNTQADTLLGDFRASNVLIEGERESLESWLLAEERSSLLKEAVEHLPPQCRAAFTLKVFHDCSYKDIAERLGIAPKTVEIHVSRGIRDTYRYLRQRYQFRDLSVDHD